jgi:gluconate:H+ symporter, GntP family
MSGGDVELLIASLLGIGLAIWLIVRVGLPSFLGLMCGAVGVGLLAGLDPGAIAVAIQKGFGDILSSVGIVLVLGLTLGAMLQISGAAGDLAGAALGLTGARYAAWGSLLAAMFIGLPLFFETGVVLLMPIVGAAATRLAALSQRNQDGTRVHLMLSGLAGLSVLHALLPPHPGPLLAIGELHASLGKTIAFGLLVAIPTAVISGPPLGSFLSRNIVLDRPASQEPVQGCAPPRLAALTVVLLPLALIAANAILPFLPMRTGRAAVWISELGSPALALLAANLAGLLLLFPRGADKVNLQKIMWERALQPAAGILLSIGMGGALKQVLVSAGVSDMLARLFAGGSASPILTAWLLAAAIRLATGSATVATITAAGLMPAIAVNARVEPEWIALAVGAGSVFFSHVNDPGFWLVKGYLGTSTADTFRTWSCLETVISVTGVIMIWLASRIF